MQRAYLDHNATSALRPSARDAMIGAMEYVGNPSSVHAEGRLARSLTEGVRRQLAESFDVPPRNVIFTSGATEAASMVLRPLSVSRAGRLATRLAMGATEHSCVLSGHGFGECADIAAVTEHGDIDIDMLDRQLAAWGRQDGLAMIAVQAANNETGICQPLDDIQALARAHGAIWVCDVVQAVGKMNLDRLSADVLFMSAHKFGGPKGIGAIILRGAEAGPQLAMIRGGGQQFGLRAGTENVIGIVGMGAAFVDASADWRGGIGKRWARMRGAFEAALKQQTVDLTIMGEHGVRLDNVSCLMVPGMDTQKAVIKSDLAGIALSAGSACSSGKVGVSHVLTAMGHDEAGPGALRISLGWNSSDQDVALFLNHWPNIIGNASGNMIENRTILARGGPPMVSSNAVVGRR